MTRLPFILIAGALFAALPAVAQVYPSKSIRLIVPFPPGGSADPLARVLGTWFSDKLGVAVIADNRPGAGTAITHTLAARAAPAAQVLKLRVRVSTICVFRRVVFGQLAR